MLKLRQLLLTTEDLVQNYEDKIETNLIVLGFGKAFDVVPDQRLLHKLDHYRIRGSTILTSEIISLIPHAHFDVCTHGDCPDLSAVSERYHVIL